jgi:hypothetical protein
MLSPTNVAALGSSRATSYPLLFVFLALIVFSLGAFGECVFAGGALAYVIAAAALVSLLCAIGSVVYAVLRQPSLLRSEEHEFRARLFDQLLLDESLTWSDRVELLHGLQPSGRKIGKPRGSPGKVSDADASTGQHMEGEDG